MSQRFGVASVGLVAYARAVISRRAFALPALAILLAQGCRTHGNLSDGSPGDLSMHAEQAALRDAGPADSGPPEADVLDADPQLHDFLLTDARPAGAAVLYAVGSEAAALRLRSVPIEGTALPRSIPSWSGFVDFDPLELAGWRDALPNGRDEPHLAPARREAFPGVILPGGRGSLHYFHRRLLGTSGLVLVRPQGTLEILLEVPSPYASALSQPLGLTSDGSVGAVVLGRQRLVLFRTDGGTFASSGKSSCEISGTSNELLEVRSASLTFVGEWLYCVGHFSSGSDQLLRAPLDGSAALAAISLPAPSATLSIADGLASSADYSRLAVAAGPSAIAQELFIVDVATGRARQMTRGSGVLAPQGRSLGEQGGQLALSPRGTLTAYVQGAAGEEELMVSPTDGSGVVLRISDDAHFVAAVTTFLNLLFIDEENLLFMAGLSGTQLDLYHWQRATGRSVNLTGYGGRALPFDGNGAFAPRGAWRSPRGDWLYWLEEHPSTGATDLRGISLASRRLVVVTEQAVVDTSSGAFAACPSSGSVYFVALASVADSSFEVWGFDQQQPQRAARLSTMSANPAAFWDAAALVLSSDCSRLAWIAGAELSHRDVWFLETSRTMSARRLTYASVFVAPSLYFTPRGEAIVFASGADESSTTLKALAIGGARPVTLDSTAGYAHVFSVF